MSDSKDVLRSALSQLALAIVPHLAEELITAVTAHFQNAAPQPLVSDKAKTTAQLAEEDAAREDAANAAAKTEQPAKTGGRRQRGAGAAADANAAAAEKKEPEPEAKTEGTTGGRKRRQKASEQQKTEETKLIADNTEQAALRAQLIVDLGDLADVEEAHPKVAAALSAVGAATIDQVASADLVKLAEAVDALIEEYYGDEE